MDTRKYTFESPVDYEITQTERIRVGRREAFESPVDYEITQTGI